MRIVNPYSGIDFAQAKRVNGISHEHIFATPALKNAYDRGIRWFACVNYQPAVSAAPSLAGWSATYKRWNYYDVSATHPTGGIDGSDIYTPELAKETIPPSYVTDGVVIAYKTSDSNTDYEKYEDGSWSLVGDLDSALELMDATYTSSCSPFTAENGDEVNPAELPALGNAEHAILRGENGQLESQHFNVLGNMKPESCVWVAPYYPRSFVNEHPIIPFTEMEQFFSTDLQFTGKVFGTINHQYKLPVLRHYLDGGGSLFKAMELFNQGATKERCQMFRDAYDQLLREGRRLYVLAVADWQGDIEETGYDGQDMTGYVKECNFDRGCNVLYMPSNYDSLTKEGKTEAGLDAYLAGTYYASGLGRHYITGLSVSGNIVTFSVDGTPSKMKVITTKGTYQYTNTNSVKAVIRKGDTFVRFEAYYYGDSYDMDFIFTNPLWIEDNESDNSALFLLLLS